MRTIISEILERTNLSNPISSELQFIDVTINSNVRIELTRFGELELKNNDIAVEIDKTSALKLAKAIIFALENQ